MHEETTDWKAIATTLAQRVKELEKYARNESKRTALIDKLQHQLAACEKERDTKDRQVAELYDKWTTSEKELQRFRSSVDGNKMMLIAGQHYAQQLADLCIWMTGCGYDFCQHEYFVKQRDTLFKQSADTSALDAMRKDTELLKEATLISAAYDRIRTERTLAADDPEYDLFAWGWKAAIDAAMGES